jgi:transcriptional regulator with XRE-family HTH domain
MYNQGFKIKKEREKKGIKQLELAEAVNVSQSWLSKVESELSQPDSNTLEKIANYLNVPIQYFIKEGFVLENQNVHDKANGIFVEAENNNLNNLNNLIVKLENIINQKDNIIDILQKEIITLNEKVDRKNKKIDELLNK